MCPQAHPPTPLDRQPETSESWVTAEPPDHEPDPALYEQIREAASSGQTRYEELREELRVSESELDPALMQLAKDGHVSIVAVGSKLSIQAD